jgi:hypothetical protein
VQLDGARGRAPIDDMPLPADPGRIAAALVLLGSACQVLRMFMPWVEKTIFSISLAKFDIKLAAILLAALAVVAAGVAIFVLIQPPPTNAVGVTLIVLALAQLGVAVWHGFGIVTQLGHSPHVWADAIGTGIYLGVIAALISLWGGVLAWAARGSAVEDER